MTATVFELPTMESELAELAAVGITVVLEDGRAAIPGSHPATVDAAANWFLRRACEEEQERVRLRGQMQRDLELIQAHYARLLEPVERRKEQWIRLAEDLARTVELDKKKTRDLLFGAYGRRKVPAHVAVRDDTQLIAWASTQAPQLVRATVKLPLTRAEELGIATGAKLEVLKTPLDQHVKETGELPDGCELIPESDQPFARLDMAAFELARVEERVR